MLQKYKLSVAKEEMEKVDTLRYAWEKLLARSGEVQNELVSLQPKFRGELISNVQVFVEDCEHFYADYEKVSSGRWNNTYVECSIKIRVGHCYVIYILGWTHGAGLGSTGSQR